MVDRKKIISYIDDYLFCREFSDVCPNGLQIEGLETVKKMATAVSASEDTIDLAISKGIDLLVVHHGLFWKGDSFVITGAKRRKLKKLLSAGLNLAAYHLPLDAHSEVGNNWVAAKEMGWKNLQPFGEFNGSMIGVRGTIEETEVSKLRAILENYYDHPAHFAPGSGKLVKSCALISGGAHRSILEAAKCGVDCFITGSFDEPNWHDAKEWDIPFFALGHSATERVGPRSLAAHLEEKFGISCPFLDLPNPF